MCLPLGARSGKVLGVRWIMRVSAPATAIAFMALAGCSDSASSPSSASALTAATAEVPADVVFATGAFLDISDTWSGPAQLTVQQKTDSGSWVDIRTLDGPLTALAALPDGDYLLWDFDTPLAHFSVTRG